MLPLFLLHIQPRAAFSNFLEWTSVKLLLRNRTSNIMCWVSSSYSLMYFKHKSLQMFFSAPNTFSTIYPLEGARNVPSPLAVFVKRRVSSHTWSTWRGKIKKTKRLKKTGGRFSDLTFILWLSVYMQEDTLTWSATTFLHFISFGFHVFTSAH